jgi:hypothetical protein
MPRTGLAATALSLVALLASCGTGDQPAADRPEATESIGADPPVSETATPTVARPLTYSDDYAIDPGPDIHWRMKSIQYGDRVLRPGLDVTAIDLTDDGLALVAADGGIYFTDGATTEKIGELTIQGGMSWANWGVKTSTSGSLVAWFTPLGLPDRSLVVYDTQERRVLAEVPRPDCVADETRRLYDELDACSLAAVVGDRVYYWSWPHPRRDAEERRLMVLDVPTERASETGERALSEDLRSQPRGFVKGNDYDTGEVVTQDINTEAVFFVPRGSSLELWRVVRTTGADIDGDGEGDGPVVYGYGGFDTIGRRLNLRLPAGYAPAENPYALFQWLDDDRFAVMAGATDDFGMGGWSGYGDILVCDIARARCTLAVPGPAGDCSTSSMTACTFDFRLVPHLTLPN